MKTLVTGAAGFIGSHVVRELLARGREVRALVKPGEDTRNLDGLDVERVGGDVCEPESIRQALQGCGRLFHLAAIYAIWLKDRRAMYDVNVVGSQNVLLAALRADLERVVYTSSIAALGVKGGGQPADEATPFNQVGRGNDYIFSKWLSQELALSFAREDLPLTVVNPAFPFGARDRGPTPTGRIILDLIKGKMPGYFDAGLNMVDVEDVARGHLLAEEQGKVGECYLLANRNMTMKEFIDLVGEVLAPEGIKLKKLHKIPIKVAIALGYLLEWRSDHITHKRPVISGQTLRYGNQHLYYDNAKARRELGLTFTPVEDSIRRAYHWFVENGYLRSSAASRA